jgi:hypothetical protein
VGIAGGVAGPVDKRLTYRRLRTPSDTRANPATDHTGQTGAALQLVGSSSTRVGVDDHVHVRHIPRRWVCGARADDHSLGTQTVTRIGYAVVIGVQQLLLGETEDASL